MEEWLKEKYGYLITIGILLWWLFGVVRGWKWAYETDSWKENTLREMLGTGMYRFLVGLLLVAALAAAFYLLFCTEEAAG